MHELTVNPWTSLAYLVAGMCFILALRGLSSPASSQRGNRFGIVGMTIAVVTTLATHVPVHEVSQIAYDLKTGAMSEGYSHIVDYTTIIKILAAIGIGAAIGLVTARRIAMTDMPQLRRGVPQPRRPGRGTGRRRRLPQPAGVRDRRHGDPDDRPTVRSHPPRSAGSKWGWASRLARSPSQGASSRS